jgi:hypothetical protein
VTAVTTAASETATDGDGQTSGATTAGKRKWHAFTVTFAVTTWTTVFVLCTFPNLE